MNDSPKKLERLKYQLSSKLEAQKWDYRKQELKYLEAGQHLRALNQIMWQVPSMAIALTGGLWYGTTLLDSAKPRIALLLFAFLVNFVTIFVLFRLRSIIEKQILIQNRFAEGVPLKTDEPDSPKKERDRIVVKCWSALLVGAAILSVAAAFSPSELSAKKTDSSGTMACHIQLDIGSNSNGGILSQPASPVAIQQLHSQCP